MLVVLHNNKFLNFFAVGNHFKKIVIEFSKFMNHEVRESAKAQK